MLATEITEEEIIASGTALGNSLAAAESLIRRMKNTSSTIEGLSSFALESANRRESMVEGFWQSIL